MGKADLHIHTTYSYDSACTVPAVLDWAANIAGLDVIAITDHDVFDGALEALDLAPRFGIEVIPGCEVTTAEGHLLGLFMKKPVPAGRSLLETVLKIGEQGGLCVAAHPLARLVHGIKAESMRAVIQDTDARQVLVGLETWNTGVFYQGSNQRAQLLNDELKISATGGSDSHVVWTIGFGYTAFPGFTAADVRTALQSKTTSAHRVTDHRPLKYWPNHLFSRLLRELGWVTWTAEPNGSFVLRRLADVQQPG